MGLRWKTKTPSTKLLFLILPLLVLTVFIGAKNSYWGPLIKDNDGVGVVAEARSTVVDGGGNTLSSSYPPLAMEDDMDVQLPRIAVEDDNMNTTLDASTIFISTNQTHLLPVNARIKRTHTSLDKLEAGLRRARAVIKEAESGNQTHDPDYVPNDPIYRNPAVFHRSYLEMEKQFKVFVYEEGEPPIFHHGPCMGTYAVEGNFIYHMETSNFRTKNPEKAHVFFLPMSVVTIVQYIYLPAHGRNWHSLRQTVKDYVDLVAIRYPFWNRSLGVDHFFTSCHDWGPDLSEGVPNLFKNSIRALCNANASEGFVPSKDVSIPEIRLMPGVSYEWSSSQRHILAFFAGGVHGPIRPILMKHWEGKDPDMQFHRYLPKGVSYINLMKKSKYCISPSGYEVASPRMVEALYTGCVPVLIKDHYVAPFSDVLNWKKFAVMLAVEDIPNLKNILTGISAKQYQKMQMRGKQARRHFEVNFPPKRYDAFHMILHSVWLRRLNVQIQGDLDP